jgi:hypothetical protein
MRVQQVLRATAAIEEARRNADRVIFAAVRQHGVPVRVLAEEMDCTRQNIYARVRKGAAQLDQ